MVDVSKYKAVPYKVMMTGVVLSSLVGVNLSSHEVKAVELNGTEKSISGYVFKDVNKNNLYDKEVDQKVSGFKVSVNDDKGVLVDETKTDAEGNYELVVPNDGTYSVNFDMSDLSLQHAIANIDYNKSEDVDSDGPLDVRVDVKGENIINISQGYYNIEVPVVEAPTTETPTTETPTTETPTTETPTTETPTTETLTTETPTTETPTTEAPTTEEPTVEDNTVEQPTPTVEEPTTEESTIEESIEGVDSIELPDTTEDSDKVDNTPIDKGFSKVFEDTTPVTSAVSYDPNKGFGDDSSISTDSNLNNDNVEWVRSVDNGNSVLPDTGEEKKSLASLGLGLGLGGLIMILFGRKKKEA